MNGEQAQREDEPIAGLIVEIADGRFFAIAWADLIQFRVSAAYAPLLRALTAGAEPDESADEVFGFGEIAAGEGTRAFLTESLREPGERPPAIRRLAAWILLP